MEDSRVCLMYHDIVTADDTSSGFQNESAFQYKVQDHLFEEQVKQLKDQDVVFTFDDGGESFLTVAAPILEKYSQRGIFFIATNYIGTPGFLTEEQVLELHRRGHIIGSHTNTHPKDISKASVKVIEEEWSSSLIILSNIIGEAVKYASIPNGNGSKTVYACARKAGITELYTSVPTNKVNQEEGLSIYGRYVVHNNSDIVRVSKIATDRKFREKEYKKWLMISLIKKSLGSFYKPLKKLIVKK